MEKLLLDLYKKMFLIRETEEEICREYPKDEMKTPMHMSLGQEAIAAGVCQALPKSSHCYGTYRSHALYLAWTEETDKFFAELYGKSSGASGGKAGSMHLASPEHGLMATSAVVGTTLPLALGDAFEAKYNNKDRVTAVFFGDGATDEGIFWETLNSACVQELPILFVCEDNDLAIHIPKIRRRGFDSLAKVVSQFRINTVVDAVGDDAEKIYNLAKGSIDAIKHYNKPSFMNLSYYRCLEHVGTKTDFDAGYRSETEYDVWMKKDPVNTLREKLLKKDIGQVHNLEAIIKDQVFQSRLMAQKAASPTGKDLLKGVYSGK